MSRQIPQGIEVLVLKAAVDPDFKQLLLERRTAAAETIELELTAAEAAMLAAVPAAQLEAIIARSSVPQEHRRAFLGQAAAAMLAALGASTATPVMAWQGIGPGLPPPKKEKPVTLAGRVIEIISKRTGAEGTRILRNDALVRDLGAKPANLVELRKDLEKEFNIEIPPGDFKKIGTVGDMIDYVEKARKKKTAPAPPASRGIRPDMPPYPAPGGIRPE